jgi:hypothetical protein
MRSRLSRAPHRSHRPAAGVLVTLLLGAAAPAAADGPLCLQAELLGPAPGDWILSGEHAVDGDRVAVGLPWYGDGVQGAVAIFDHDGTDWVMTALIPHPGSWWGGASFGHALALKGDILLVGTLDESDAKWPAPPVYAFAFDGTQWNLQATLVSPDYPDGDPLNDFGYSLAFDGSTAIIGAPGYEIFQGFGRGEAYVYSYDSGVWTQTQRLKPVTSPCGDPGWTGGSFGCSVAFEGDHLVIGAETALTPGCPGSGSTQHGAVYFYERVGTVWYEVAVFQDEALPPSQGFGVTLAGDWAMARTDPFHPLGLGGALQAFWFDGTQWTAQGAVALPGEVQSVDMEGDRAIATTWDLQTFVHVLERQGMTWSVASTHPMPGNASVGARLEPGGLLLMGIPNVSGLPDGVRLYDLDGFPLIETEQLYIPDNGTAEMGSAIAADGDRMIVGAHIDDTLVANAGAAHVYDRSGGAWTKSATLLAGDGASLDAFGFSVGISGDRAVAGAYGHDGLFTGAGAAYVFERQGGAWVETQKLLPADGAANDYFGHSVAIHGNRIAVAAPRHDLPLTGAGAVYVFEHDGTSWTQTAKITVSDPQGNHQIGWGPQALALEGDRLVIGATDDGQFALAKAGAVYVFDHDGTSWVETAKLVASVRLYQAHLGNAVALEGDRIVAGSWARDVLAASSGAAHVFEWDGAAWSETAMLYASDGGISDWLGWSVALRGRVVIAGAYLADTQVAGSGAAYVFVKSDSGWVEHEKIAASDAGGDWFGKAVAVGTDYALIGAPAQDWPNGQNGGSVYAFELDCVVPVGTAAPEAQPVAIAPGARLVPFPNPVSAGGTLSVSFALPAAGPFTLNVYDVAGRRARSWRSAALQAGPVRRELGLQGLAPGVYFLRLEAGGTTQSGKFTLVR